MDEPGGLWTSLRSEHDWHEIQLRISRLKIQPMSDTRRGTRASPGFPGTSTDSRQNGVYCARWRLTGRYIHGSEAATTDCKCARVRTHERGRRTASRSSLYAALLLLCGCVYFSKHTVQGACSDDLDSPIRNFWVVAPAVLWRGERPTGSDAKWLLEHRDGSVVSLQLDDRRTFESAALGRDSAHSVSYFQEPHFPPLQMLSRSQIDNHVARFVAIVGVAPTPIYFHCRAGIDRTGVLAAAYRVLIEERAVNRLLPGWDAFTVRGFDSIPDTSAAFPRLARRRSWWKSGTGSLGCGRALESRACGGNALTYATTQIPMARFEQHERLHNTSSRTPINGGSLR